jgi:hypothetical protein
MLMGKASKWVERTKICAFHEQTVHVRFWRQYAHPVAQTSCLDLSGHARLEFACAYQQQTPLHAEQTRKRLD